MPELRILPRTRRRQDGRRGGVTSDHRVPQENDAKNERLIHMKDEPLSFCFVLFIYASIKKSAFSLTKARRPPEGPAADAADMLPSALDVRSKTASPMRDT